jgi:hypothetical protein
MKHLTDSTLSVIDRASSKLGPLSSLLDKLVERVIPTTTAAACSGAFCGAFCDTVQRCNSAHLTYGHYRYGFNSRSCQEGIIKCSIRFCGCPPI